MNIQHRRNCLIAIAASIAMIILLVTLSGCSKPSKTGGSTVHLTLACWEGPEGMASLAEMLDKYKKMHPNVSVEIQQVAGDQYYQRLKIQFAAGVAADIMQLGYDKLPAFAEKGTIEPLDKYIKRDKFPVNGMFPEVIPTIMYKNKFYGLPRGWTTFALYYNKDMFRKAGVPFPRSGWTWNDFLNACKKMTKDTNGDGKLDQFGCDAPTQIDGIAAWIWQNGGRMFTPDMKHCLLDQPEAIEALQFLADCQYKYKVFPSPDQAQDLGGGGEMFRNGRQAMFIAGRWACMTFKDATYPDGRKIDWDCAEIPMGKHKATVIFSSCYVLRKNGPNTEEAWKLMKWLTGIEGQRHQARTGRDMPSFVSVANSPDFNDPKRKPDNDRAFMDVAKYARPLEIDTHIAATGDLMTNEITQIFTMHKDVKKAMREIVPKIDKIEREDD